MGRGIMSHLYRMGVVGGLFFRLASASNVLVMTDFDAQQYHAVETRMIQERIASGLRAVGPGGRLIFVQGYASRSQAALERFGREPRITLIPHDPRGLKAYPWIRDEIAGFNRSTHAFVRSDANNPPGWIDSVFEALSQSDPVTEAVAVPWGNMIENGKGLCLVSDADLDSDERGVLRAVYAKRMGCTRVLIVPYESVPHPNDHLDLYAQFVAEDALVLSSVPQDCDGDVSVWVRSKLRLLEAFFGEQLPDVRILRVPFAACPTIQEGFPDEPVHVELLSYANLVSFEEAILLPDYVGMDGESDFSKIRDLLRDQTGKTVERFPVPVEQARSGGSLRCLTWDGS